MRYEFGSNKLNIGKGIMNILDYLEDSYGLDFEMLEEEYLIDNGLKEID